MGGSTSREEKVLVVGAVVVGCPGNTEVVGVKTLSKDFPDHLKYSMTGLLSFIWTSSGGALMISFTQEFVRLSSQMGRTDTYFTGHPINLTECTAIFDRQRHWPLTMV